MARRAAPPLWIDGSLARRIWLAATRLDTTAPFGDGPQATVAAVEHLGYVQIDTIHVIERCHHHILFSRIPGYRRTDLQQAQSTARQVCEAWTHALAYVPTRDLRFHLPRMLAFRREPPAHYARVTPADVRRLLARIRREGPLALRDIDDDEPIEKTHPWGSRKPSRQVLQYGFHAGLLAIARRDGMQKAYELMDRHFGWPPRPRPATPGQVAAYQLERALRCQGLVNLESICYLDTAHKPLIAALAASALRTGRLRAVLLSGADDTVYWVRPEVLEAAGDTLRAAQTGPRSRSRTDPVQDGAEGLAVHLLSPFDPLIIQRARLARFFGYEHRFEAYLPAERRRFGYFALPVLAGDRIVAAIDLKADRTAGRLEIRQWTWVEAASAALRQRIERALGCFELFQLAR